MKISELVQLPPSTIVHDKYNNGFSCTAKQCLEIMFDEARASRDPDAAEEWAGRFCIGKEDRVTITKEECEKSFYLFVKRAFQEVESHAKFIYGWHIKAICDHFEAVRDGKIEKLLINLPPGHMASLISSVMFPAWVRIHDKNQRFSLATYAQMLSNRNYNMFKVLYHSDWYKGNWDLGPFTGSSEYTCAENIHNEVGEVEYLIIDSANNPSGLMSKNFDVIRWFEKARRQAKKIVCIQSRLHDSDLSGKITIDGDGWEYLRLPMQYQKSLHCRNSIFEDPRKGHEGEILWPEVFTFERLDLLTESMNRDKKRAQLQQDP